MSDLRPLKQREIDYELLVRIIDDISLDGMKYITGAGALGFRKGLGLDSDGKLKSAMMRLTKNGYLRMPSVGRRFEADHFYPTPLGVGRAENWRDSEERIEAIKMMARHMRANESSEPPSSSLFEDDVPERSIEELARAKPDNDPMMFVTYHVPKWRGKEEGEGKDD